MLSLDVKSVAKAENLSVSSDAILEDVFELMTRNNEGTAVLLKEGMPVGIITERDVVRIIYNDISLNEPASSYASEPVITVRDNRTIGFALNIMIDNNIRRVVVVDQKSEFHGVITQQSLIKKLERDFYKESLRVSHLLRDKPPLILLNENSTLSEALGSMVKANIGVLPLMKGNELCGIITERDVLRLSNEKVSLNEKVIAHAAKPVYSVQADCLIEEVVETMIQRDFRRVVVVDESNHPIGILTNRDIFRHIEKNYSGFLEEKIKNAKEVLNYIPEVIIEVMNVENEHIIKWCNRKAMDVFTGNLLDKPITDFIQQHLWTLVEEGVEKEDKFLGLTIHLEQGIYELSAYRLKQYEDKHIQLILKDITQLEVLNRSLQSRVEEETKKRMHHEQLLINQSKLAEMGEMIGIIAHQWKQPLNNLSLLIQDLEEAYDYNEINKSYLEEMVRNSVEQIDFMATTIDDFRNFFRPSRKETLFQVDDCIKQVLSIVSPQMKRNYIDIKFSLRHAKESRIHGFENEFKQVILNLLNNSKDAIIDRREKGGIGEEERGEITISTETRGKHLSIKVADNGGGIDEETLPHVFDAYFTTKSDSIGTGIGLHLSKIIVEEKMNGRIFAGNENEGAVFTIEVPFHACN